MKQKVLVLFSIMTSILSATIGFMQRFISTLTEVDAIIIFYAGIFLIFIVALLLYFLFREVVKGVSENAKEAKKIEEKEKISRRRRAAQKKKKK